VTAGVSLIFRNLEYAIGPKGSAKKILKGVTGKIAPGEMCALMGGSGAGKSTLLDLLAYRKTSGFITGEYYINGKPDKPSARWCSYVTQDNVHIGCFTVRPPLDR
jgi:ABC-type multidrug transport system ATPase subunit